MAILHRTRTLPALLPRYVSRFSCIGPACEDNCCVGWHVAIDKKTFKAYRQSKHPELSASFAQHLKRHTVTSTQLNYASIVLEPVSAQCPFMQERLCSIQQKLDESYLSNTCFSYPRLSNSFGGQHQQALVLSCPEAARQALLAPDAFDFIEGTMTVRPDLLSAIDTKHGLSRELMHDVRLFCLNLIRVKGMEVWQRLALLGVFCESLRNAVAAGEQHTLPALMDGFATVVEQGQLLDALNQLQPNYSAQALVFATLWGSRSFVSTSPTRNQVVNSVARGLGADPETGQVSSEQLIECYRRGVARLPQALQSAPHLLEHYLLNELFLTLFPFDRDDPYESYLQLVSRFGLLRLMLAAQCNTDGPLPDAATLVLTVQAHCRRFQHDPAFAERVKGSLSQSGGTTLDKLYAFLRT